jgi:hypothetical protein
LLAACAVIAVLAAASLLLPWDPVYDPWGWLVWGREVTGLDLDTSSGPSWKPLPVLFTTPLSVFGDAAPDLWLAVARAGWLAAPALAALLAARVAERLAAGRRERIAAGVVAGLGVVLLSDGFTPWLRQFAGGLAEPLMVTLLLAAVERGLAGRDRTALALGAAAALVRPEAWPALLLYAAWLWRARPAHRVAAAAAIAAVAALWFVPDLLGSGSFLTGADRAREGSGSPPVEALEVIGRAATLPLAVFWVGLVAVVVVARRRGDRAIVVVAAVALGWIALVAVMAAGGYAGLPRFIAPAAGVAIALGAAGLAHLVASVRGPGVRPAVVVGVGALAAALLLQASLRIAALSDDAANATEISRARSQLDAIVAGRGADRIRACGPAVAGAIDGQTAIAWLLDVPIADVEVSRTPPSRGFFFERTDEGWRGRELGCPNMPPS